MPCGCTGSAQMHLFLHLLQRVIACASLMWNQWLILCVLLLWRSHLVARWNRHTYHVASIRWEDPRHVNAVFITFSEWMAGLSSDVRCVHNGDTLDMWISCV